MKVKTSLLIILLLCNYYINQTTIIKKDVLLKNGHIELPGTLSYTENSEQLIIWVHGSGNIDRNGNQGAIIKANYIKQFRDEMNKNEIAFFSYDKRTSNPKNAAYFEGILLDDFVSDVKTVVQHFKKENKFKEIILIGHSQGSLVAMLASQGVDKYISLAGVSQSIDKTIISQVSKQSPDLGKITTSYFKELQETGTIKEVSPMLASIFAKPNLSFLKNWMEYNPAKEIKKVEATTLLINGTKDIQVSIEDAKVLKASKENSQLNIVENMNHVLKHIEKDTDNMNSYYSPDFKISSELVKVVVNFIKK